jgi:BirA family biotin operon repressor/biotin-[acetyl-CoA-carboxylase] ligase
VELKWPNDLYYQGRKLAGILVEMSGSAGASCHLVIGVGLNLAMPSREGSGSIRPGPNCATSSRNW